MFVVIGKSYVNIDYVVECEPRSGLVYINLLNGDKHTASIQEFAEDILPYLPLAKKAAKKKGDE